MSKHCKQFYLNHILQRKKQFNETLIPFNLIARIMDDMGHEMENAESKMDSTLKKMAKVMHMSNGILFFYIVISHN